MDIYEGPKPAKGNHAILLDVYISAPAAKVYKAVSHPEELEKWWPRRCEGDPSLYGRYRFYFTEEYDWRGEVIAVKQDEFIAFRMTDADEDWTGSEFRFRLEEKDDLILLHFEHSGWPYDNSHYRHSAFCWAILLNGLKNYVERGFIVPFDQRN